MPVKFKSQVSIKRRNSKQKKLIKTRRSPPPKRNQKKASSWKTNNPPALPTITEFRKFIDDLTLYNVRVSRGPPLRIAKLNSPEAYAINDFSDKFVFLQRMQCRFHSEDAAPSAYKRGTISWDDVLLKVKPCTLFPVIIAYWIASGGPWPKSLAPRSWLNIGGAGWGDRLLAAVAANKNGVLDRYVGVDSNVELQPVYNQILDSAHSAGISTPDSFVPLFGNMQTVRIPDEKYDLAFDSPPFYTMEIYPGMRVWETENEYTDDFLIPYVIRVGKHLQVGGRWVVYIDQREGDTFVEEFQKIVGGIFGDAIVSTGVFYYEGFGAGRPYYTWLAGADIIDTVKMRERVVAYGGEELAVKYYDT